MEQSKLYTKLAAVQKSIAAVKKSSVNPHFRSKYADLNEVLAVCKEAADAAGLLILQTVGKNALGSFVESRVVDPESGEAIGSAVFLSGSESNMQQIGAAITYARRFSLSTLFALEAEDDDGETAVGRKSTASSPQTTPQAQISTKSSGASKAKEGKPASSAKRSSIQLFAQILVNDKKTLTASEWSQKYIAPKAKTADLTDSEIDALYKRLKSEYPEFN